MIKDALKKTISIIPPQLRKHPTYNKKLRELNKLKNLTIEETKKAQLIHLRRMIYLAYNNTSGYRQLYKEAGVQPSDIQNLTDLSLLPVVDKQILRDNIKEFSVFGPQHKYNTTGGTTGKPFGFYLSRSIFATEAAFIHNYWSTSGWQLGDKSIVLRGSYVGKNNKFITYHPYTREIYFSASHLSPSNLDSFLKSFQKHKPKFIQAYPSALSLFCDLIEECNIKDFSFKGIFLGSENIYPWQITKFKKTFPNAKISSWYGHAEKACYATLIPQSDLQYEVHPFYGIAEPGVKNENNMSEIIATGFINSSTPFIRYKTDDFAQFSEQRPANCLYPYSTILQKIDGRRQEAIISKSGQYISMASLSIHGGIFDNLKQFQFHQIEKGTVNLKYIPNGNFQPNEDQKIKESLENRFNNDISFKPIKVDEIKKTHIGKMRYLIQELDIKYNLKE